MAEVSTPSNHYMDILSRMLLSPSNASASSLTAELQNMQRQNFEALSALASTNHVIVRGMEAFRSIMIDARDDVRATWAADAIEAEQARIFTALGFLRLICDAFDEDGLDVTVMKSLDHWPDFGSDLDLYTNAPPEMVCAMMRRRFSAQIAPRSWGDRLACKWNFLVPGLPEPVEVHMGRLGQTGEQLILASRLPARARSLQFNTCTFRVPSASDRLMISTLQRMYRHFYFRLCDIVDSAELVESGQVDFNDLKPSAQAAGIWEGVATYLVIVSDYVRRYRDTGLTLPNFVLDAARFGGNLVYFGKDFLRVPIMPQSASLYRLQLVGLLRKKELHGSARLGLLPWLATAAAVGQKITGSDKGIW
ncbi:MAG TPA: hypothetical protein VHT24_03495 [Pseudacidobacterium sp.]|nr:hypothetical protein [Pseudacidobacterium sp.]